MPRRFGKQFMVIAYDITSNRRRRQLVKLLKKYGRRANYSVFECRLKKEKIALLQEEIVGIIDNRKDSVLYYYLCGSCVDRCESVGEGRKQIKITENLII